MKIYDCTTFYNEHMMYDIRLNILNEKVEKFIVTESIYSHSGQPKKLNFDINNNKKVTSIDIDVYQEMAEKSLSIKCKQAKKKWKLVDTLVIHRFGRLNINEKIVLVATFSINRQDSIAACNYIMDYLKKEAPFWKKEFYDKNYSWL